MEELSEIAPSIKYLGKTITNNDALDDAITESNTLRRTIIPRINSVLWNMKISKENKVLIYNAIIKSYYTRWPLKERSKKLVNAY